MYLACICGGWIEGFLLILGLTSLMKAVNWVRRKLHSPKRCGCCKEHAANDSKREGEDV